MNIFIEGLQGTGKTTLLRTLARKYPQYRAYYEGDITPVELAWCSYMKPGDFEKILEKYAYCKEEILAKTVQEDGVYITAYTQVLAEKREFYEEMEQYEIYNGRVPFDRFREIIMKRYSALEPGNNLFECSFFQNSIESMLLFYQMCEEEILDFYREAYATLKDKGFHLIYLDSDKIRENLEQIRRERTDAEGNEMWYPLMINYLKESPYGKENRCRDMDDLVAYLEKRRQLELRIIKEVLGEDAEILPAKE